MIKYSQIENKRHCPNITKAQEISSNQFTAFESSYVLILHLTFGFSKQSQKSVLTTLGRKAVEEKSSITPSLVSTLQGPWTSQHSWLITISDRYLFFGVIKCWQENGYVQLRSIQIVCKRQNEKTAWYLQVQDGFFVWLVFLVHTQVSAMWILMF